jgi:hypothetical protein
MISWYCGINQSRPIKAHHSLSLQFPPCFLLLKKLTFKIGTIRKQFPIALMATEPLTKKQNSRKTIGTHSGTFHCDEVLACCMLKQLPEYGDAEIIRTRDENVLKTCDIVVDVGGKYEPASHRYDHHQRYCQSVIC